MKRISSQITTIKNSYNVVIIGSGYGGGVTASRMARAGQQVCVLERGKEFLPGEFPDTPTEAASEFQVNGNGFQLGDETSLFDFHVNDEINVLIGCGLGGTSLINANVSLEADPRIFQEPIWPKAFVADLDTKLKEGFKRAENMLKPTPYPEGTENFPILKKTEAMRKSGKFVSEDAQLLPINVNFKRYKSGLNHVGVPQDPCILCGDCVSGCNHTAKNTIQMTYLPDAKNHGAEIFTKTKVSHVSQKDGKWIVHYSVEGNSSDKFNSPSQFVIADVVILAAGSLGSTEILLRSREKGLSVSNKLGKNFSGNGDALSFSYNTDHEINAVGKGTGQVDPNNPPGPCITSIIDTRATSNDFRKGMSIEEGVLPGAVAPLLPNLLSGIATLTGTDAGLADEFNEKKRIADSFFRGAYNGAMRNTMTSLVMAHDSASGEMTLINDKLRISWPGLGNETVFSNVKKKMTRITEALGGTYVPNPISNKYTANSQITVHPLGGCNMGEDASSGVVNHKGQVFSSDQGIDVYRDLYIADGSIIPMSLGTNPLLTITAISERNAKLMAKDHGWKYSIKLPSKAKSEDKTETTEEKIGIQFTEVMSGYICKKEKADFNTAYSEGKNDKNDFRFTLTIVSDDLETMLEDESHQASMYGTVEAPMISTEALTVTNGIFNLFITDENTPKTRLMKYQIKMTSNNGDIYFMQGFKTIHDDAGFDFWSDTTTLFITIYKDKITDEKIFAKGILNISPRDFATQMTTIKVSGTNSPIERLQYTAKFGKFFSGKLFDTFGGIATGLDYFSSDAPPRKKRVLKAPTPVIYPVITEDNTAIRLTRYQGGNKGPVILSHGLGVSSKIFTMDTYETNLMEYLVAQDYDVWLMDFRVSIELPSSKNQATADQIAKYDYPASIDKVLAVTGAETAQMVVHCFGATTWTMGVLGGYIKNVRSAIVSQVSIYVKVGALANLKTGLYVPEFLDKVGINSLTAYVDKESDWENKLYDKMLKLYPIQKEEQCQNPVCRRITFLYGQLYEHDQLNELTHNNLHEMYGVANMASLQHSGEIVRKGHVVTADGDDFYMNHLDRMKFPITFIGGAENECFLPESLEQTFQALKKHNGEKWYKKYSIPNYGHIDCIHGKNASTDVYPYILERLEETQSASDLGLGLEKHTEKSNTFTINNMNQENLQTNLQLTLKKIQADDGTDIDFLLSQCERLFDLICKDVFSNAHEKNIKNSALAKIGLGDLAWTLHLINDYPHIRKSLQALNSIIPDPSGELIKQRPTWPKNINPATEKRSTLWNPLSWKNLAVSIFNKLSIPNSSPKAVFESIQNASNWGEYYANGSDSSASKLDHLGQIFSFQTFNTKFDAEIVIFQNSGEVLSIGWSATALGTRVIHRWDIYSDGKTGSIVTTEEVQYGIKPALTAGMLHKAMLVTHQNWLYGHAVSAKEQSKLQKENEPPEEQKTELA